MMRLALLSVGIGLLGIIFLSAREPWMVAFFVATILRVYCR